MATHSSILAWKIPWSEEPSGEQLMWGCKELRHNLAAKQQRKIKHILLFVYKGILRGKSNSPATCKPATSLGGGSS